MEYTPFSLLVDVGWISVLMVIGNVLRRKVPVFQALLLPAPITAGLLGLLLGPGALGWIGFSDQMGAYTTLLIAVVFAAMPYSMQFDRSVRSGARTMWSYSTGMFVGQWGLFILLGIFLFQPVWGTEEWFGMMLPVGFVGGFGTAAAVGSSLEATGATAASTLGFTSATVGTLAAIVGGVIFANWGIRTGRTSEMPKKLPWEMRSGYIDEESSRPSIGKATTNPSSIEPVALHVGMLTLTVMFAYLINQAISGAFPEVSIPLFITSFAVGIVGKLILNLLGKPNYVDRDTINSLSGAATDYLIAFGIAAIVPAVVADYWVPLVVMFVLGTIYCLVFFFFIAPTFFGKKWLERAIFGWGWATAAVATGIALLKMVDPKLKSGTLNEYGVAYVGFAPFEIGMTVIAPIAVLTGWTMGLGWAATLLSIVILGLAVVLRWVPGRNVEVKHGG
ncbi:MULTISPECIES: sodium:glutamate symporter [unclassified Corynebacterium]|uniref:sodium/glutamate symporter n=1 Tax=unclassified Corynebacterium TaxID=2624378 RepID=UPI0029CA3240|nr:MULTISPECIES: sodium:glutamate symporter [unclassified Corynebacterium]WPF65943.1 sodium:glutamate symporter [Corynebacterium sp. 22KM0430]WPF68436.1 sodium:glutamate symporter [Corynebacterium sp. 21KM1197]